MTDLETWVKSRAQACIPLLAAAHYAAQTESTQEDALQYLREGKKGPALFVAGEQFKGRGRLDRRWESAAGKGLYFSLVLHPSLPATQAPLIPLAVGIALKSVLEEMRVPNILLKWPNDVWVQGKKLAGVLAELVGSAPEAEAVVLGIGANLNQLDEDFSPELRSRAISLGKILGQKISPAKILEKILLRLFSEIETLCQKGPETLVTRWEKESEMVGTCVSVRDECGEFLGVVLGLEKDGALRVEDESQVSHRILAADIRLISRSHGPPWERS